MSHTTKLIAKLALAIGLIGSLAFSAATPSLARSATASANAGSHYYEPSDNGSVWSYYPGYTDEISARQPTHRTPIYNAYAQAPASHRGGVAVDNPPGSAFQTQGNNDSMGCPC